MDWENAERTSWVIPGTPPLYTLLHIHVDRKTTPTSDVDKNSKNLDKQNSSSIFSTQDSSLIGPTDVSHGKYLIALSPSAQTWISLKVAGILYGQVEAKVAEMQF